MTRKFGEAPTRIRSWRMGGKWLWECHHCHYGYNIPWEETATWAEARDAVAAHIKRHHEIGMVEVWANALERP